MKPVHIYILLFCSNTGYCINTERGAMIGLSVGLVNTTSEVFDFIA